MDGGQRKRPGESQPPRYTTPTKRPPPTPGPWPPEHQVARPRPARPQLHSEVRAPQGDGEQGGGAAPRPEHRGVRLSGPQAEEQAGQGPPDLPVAAVTENAATPSSSS